MLAAIYWTSVDLPSWFPRRKDRWFCFGLLKCSFLDELPEHGSTLMAIILRLFFADDGDSRHKGVCLQSDGRSRIVTARFQGIIADKALKEVVVITGQAGTVPCLT